MSARLITDWVDKGLLDRPRVRGLGRGKGTRGTWPEEQARLLGMLLRNRPGAPRLAKLCNIPVWVWLVRGEQSVPLRQVRRALGTWADTYATVKQSQAGPAAIELLDEVAHPDASPGDRDDFERLISTAAQTGALDLDRLEHIGRKVIDPHSSGIARGERGMIETSALVRQIDLRLTGLAERRAPDEIYEQARALYHATQATQARTRDPKLFTAALRDRAIGRGTNQAGLNAAMTEACVDLLALNGLTVCTPPSQAPKPLTNRPRSRANGPGARHPEREFPNADPD